jgi:hypothetical protein
LRAAGVEGPSWPSSLKGSRGVREAASIIEAIQSRVLSSAPIVQRCPA